MTSPNPLPQPNGNQNTTEAGRSQSVNSFRIPLRLSGIGGALPDFTEANKGNEVKTRELKTDNLENGSAGKPFVSFVIFCKNPLRLSAPLARFLTVLLACLFGLTVSAQPSATNRVLDLDGTGGYVALPPNILDDLDEATVEMWVKWRSFPAGNVSWSRFFSYGEEFHDTGIEAYASGELHFFLSEGKDGAKSVRVRGVVRTNDWYHLAAVSGPNGMQLFFDGALLATNSYTGSFSTIKSRAPSGGRFRLGRSVVDNEPLVDAQLAEVRVWKAARTEAQIRQTMHQRLRGSEPGLAALWNFESAADGIVKDAAPGLHHGTLTGGAKIAPAEVPGFAPAVRSSKVLELDGNGSYVELPRDAFTNLTEVTVEGWVKWESFKPMSRFFDFTFSSYEMDVQNRGTNSTLWIEKISGLSATAALEQVQAPGFLSPGRWTHVAAVSSSDGIKLFADGMLVSTNVTRTTDNNQRTERRNYLGRSNWRIVSPEDADFHGQMDEVRVWKVARTEAQIRQSMFQQLTGKEPGLAGLWNFEDGTANDSSPGLHHGNPVGGAKVIATSVPSPAEIAPWTRLSGKATDATGTALNGAIIRAEVNGVELARATTSPSGDYLLTVRTRAEAVDLTGTAPNDLVSRRRALAITPHGQATADLILKPALHIAGKVVALDGKTPHVQLVVELVRPEATRSSQGDEALTSQSEFRIPNSEIGQTSAATNRVLALPGEGSHAELPPNIFRNLTQATVECWVHWLSDDEFAPLFNLGNMERAMWMVRQRTTGLGAVVASKPWGPHSILVDNVVATKSWYHLAWVTGPGGVRLYVNGVTIATNAYTGSVAALDNNEINHLGHRHPPSPARSDMVGRIDDFRVWNVERSAEEIRGNMYRRLTGAEPGLFGWWNFDDPMAPMRDASTNGHHGQLIGAAATVQEPPPTALLLGKIRDGAGTPLPGARIEVRHQGRETASAVANASGNYRVMVPAPCDLFVTTGKLSAYEPGFRPTFGAAAEKNWTLAEMQATDGSRRREEAPSSTPNSELRSDVVGYESHPRTRW